MAVRAPWNPEPVTVQVRRDAPRNHLRLLPPRSADMAARVFLLLFAVLAAIAWIIDQARTMEEDRADLEDARAALKEAEEVGTISWEEIKREHGL